MLTGPFGVSRALMSLLLFTHLQSAHVSLPKKRFWLPGTDSEICSDGVCFGPASSLPQSVSPSPACGLLPPAHPTSIPSSRAVPRQGPPAQHPCSKPILHPSFCRSGSCRFSCISLVLRAVWHCRVQAGFCN